MRKLITLIVLAMLLSATSVFAPYEGDQGWMNQTYFFPPYGSYFFWGWGEDFGDFYYYEEHKMIYHPKTASYWFVFGNSPDSIFLYGPNWKCWAWTGRGIYPWIYFYTSKQPDIIPTGWAYLSELEVRPDGKVWALMIYPETTSGFKSRVILPF